MELIEELEQTRKETLGFFELSPAELDRSNAPDKWTIREVLHHLCARGRMKLNRCISRQR